MGAPGNLRGGLHKGADADPRIPNLEDKFAPDLLRWARLMQEQIELAAATEASAEAQQELGEGHRELVAAFAVCPESGPRVPAPGAPPFPIRIIVAHLEFHVGDDDLHFCGQALVPHRHAHRDGIVALHGEMVH